MNQPARDAVMSWFHRFVRGYKDKDGTLTPMLQLKLDHSQRVADDCRAIASDLGWPDDERHTAEIVGLLHDVGRFPQFTQYRTFLDSASVNHGECGYHTLSASDGLESCGDEDAVIVRDSVRHHNRRHIPDALTPRSLPFLKLIRDADKLDILFVVNDTIRHRRYTEFPEILLHVDMEGPPNPVLVREIRETRSGRFENVKTLADMGLIRLAWVYDLNYAPTLRRLSERRLMDDLYGILPDTPELRALITDVQRHIETRLSA